MKHIQLSLFGKTSWELFHQITGWILRPCSFTNTEIPMPDSGVWANAGMVRGNNVDVCWTSNIGESPHLLKEEEVSFSWQILERNVPQKNYLKPAICNRFLRLAERAGCPPPLPVEYLLKKQGGKYPSSDPFKKDACEVRLKKETKKDSTEVLEEQKILFQLCSQDQ
ncbi:hypothetical protein [Bacillus sp. FSL K6-3431]|uniref:hypothetical protein n=1 Tax=Bacillus sp. FSL K6-3431 TaxID=2921500 RepID=UPI0030F5DCDD